MEVGTYGKVSNDEGLQEPSKEKYEADGSYKLFFINNKR